MPVTIEDETTIIFSTDDGGITSILDVSPHECNSLRNHFIREFLEEFDIESIQKMNPMALLRIVEQLEKKKKELESEE